MNWLRPSCFVFFWWISFPGFSTSFNGVDSIFFKGHPTDSLSLIAAGSRGLNRAEVMNRAEDPIVIGEFQLPDSIAEERARAHTLAESIQQAGRYRETLDANTIADLPIGIVRAGGSVDYSIVVDRVSFNALGSELTAYMSFTIPQTGDQIAFGGKIPLSKDGGIVGTARIFLIGDHLIKLNNATLLTLKGSLKNNTYVEIDCDGFKAMSVEADVEFSRDLLVPEDERGVVIPDKRVKFNFQTYIRSWNELLVKVSVPPFQVRGLEGFGFAVQDAFLDWSDLANPPGLIFPPNYQSVFSGQGQSFLWRGIFLRSAYVRAPASFKDRQGAGRPKFGAENLILDDAGISGQAFAENLIRAGDMSGWSYSIDRLKLMIASNQVAQFEFQGKITVPVLETEGKPVQMAYRAARDANDNYIFAVTVSEKMSLPLWAADLTLLSGSSVVVKEKDDRFYPSAILNGMMSIRAMNKGPKTEITGVRFEQLQISAEEPYFRGGTFGVGNADEKSKAAGYPLVIRNVGIKSDKIGKKVGLALDVTINIGGDPAREGFSGTAGLVIWGRQGSRESGNKETADAKPPQEQWHFENVELSAVGIAIKKPNLVELSGLVRFFDNDPVFGDGFRGELKGVFHQKIGMQATALFGRTDTFRYWFADALGEMRGGVQLAPGLAAYGFGGGFFSNMKQGQLKNGLGSTPSGMSYVPDESSTGLRAVLMFGSPGSERAFNGDAALEIAMNRSGGVNTVGLTGNAYFLTPAIDHDADRIRIGANLVASHQNLMPELNTPRSQVYGRVNILFDNQNDIFHGDVEVFVNTAGGLVKGIGPSYKAGWAVVHFAASEWYVLMGTPEQPIGLEVARLFKARTYLMMGENLPGSPPPPDRVSDILGGVKLDGARDFNALHAGSGFAFGMNFGMDTGDLRFLLFYGRFAAGAGFDIMMKNYGEGNRCENSSGAAGINGWFADGQAYAYLEGKIGIKVNLKFYKGDYDILAIGTAAILQTRGPSPFWMRGTVGGYYNILGGLVKGQCRFDLVVGEECKPASVNTPLQDVTLIADVSPVKGSKDIDVFNAPQAAFNVPMGEIFTITNARNETRNFRASLNEFLVRSDNGSVAGTLKWNEAKDVVAFDPVDVLPPEKNITVRVRVAFEEQVGTEWRPFVVEGKPAEETVESAFITGKAPDFIPPSNIELSYPIPGQFNFYPREYNQGFVKLKKGQGYLFAPGPNWIQKARLAPVSGQGSYSEIDITYNESDRTIRFELPRDLALGKVHRFEILNLPRFSRLLDENVKVLSEDLISEDSGAAELTTRRIDGQLNLLEAKSIFEAYFRTSSFSSFNDKVNSISLSTAYRVAITVNAFQLRAYLKGPEPFDQFELAGNSTSGPLVRCEAWLEQNKWYQDEVFPIVYEGYPLLGNIFITSREPDQLGLPPAKSVFVDEQGSVPSVDGQGDVNTPTPSGYRHVAYDLMTPMFSDYTDIQTKVANYVVDRPDRLTPRLGKILLNRLPIFRSGRYAIKLKYAIPGVGESLRSSQWDLVNEIQD